MATQVILLEKIEKLGSMGDVVNVKPGYARNYLLPQSKALRATKDNIAYFEAQKATLEKANNEKKKEAEKRAKSLEGLTVSIIRQASEGGQLYGSVTSRDIADAVSAEGKEKIERGMVALNQNFKMIGLFPVPVALHPEVKVDITINIARSSDEAKIQAKTGKALVADEAQAQEEPEAKAPEQDEEAKAELLEESAIEAEKEAAQAQAEKDAKAEAKAQAKAEKKAEKEAAAVEEDSEAESEEGTAEAQAADAADETQAEDASEEKAKEE